MYDLVPRTAVIALPIIVHIVLKRVNDFKETRRIIEDKNALQHYLRKINTDKEPIAEEQEKGGSSSRMYYQQENIEPTPTTSQTHHTPCLVF